VRIVAVEPEEAGALGRSAFYPYKLRVSATDSFPTSSIARSSMRSSRSTTEAIDTSGVQMGSVGYEGYRRLWLFSSGRCRLRAWIKDFASCYVTDKRRLETLSRPLCRALLGAC